MANVSKCFTWTVASSVVSIDNVSNCSHDSSILLVNCIEAPESTRNSRSTWLMVEVDATLHSVLGFLECSFRSPVAFLEFCTTCWPTAKLLFLHHLLPTTCKFGLCLQRWAYDLSAERTRNILISNRGNLTWSHPFERHVVWRSPPNTVPSMRFVDATHFQFKKFPCSPLRGT